MKNIKFVGNYSGEKDNAVEYCEKGFTGNDTQMFLGKVLEKSQIVKDYPPFATEKDIRHKLLNMSFNHLTADEVNFIGRTEFTFNNRKYVCYFLTHYTWGENNKGNKWHTKTYTSECNYLTELKNVIEKGKDGKDVTVAKEVVLCSNLTSNSLIDAIRVITKYKHSKANGIYLQSTLRADRFKSKGGRTTKEYVQSSEVKDLLNFQF